MKYIVRPVIHRELAGWSRPEATTRGVGFPESKRRTLSAAATKTESPLVVNAARSVNAWEAPWIGTGVGFPPCFGTRNSSPCRDPNQISFFVVATSLPQGRSETSSESRPERSRAASPDA